MTTVAVVRFPGSLDHDSAARAVEGLGGYTRAEFVVEAPREMVHINPGYYCDAQLLVQSMERPELMYSMPSPESNAALLPGGAGGGSGCVDSHFVHSNPPVSGVDQQTGPWSCQAANRPHDHRPPNRTSRSCRSS